MLICVPMIVFMILHGKLGAMQTVSLYNQCTFYGVNTTYILQFNINNRWCFHHDTENSLQK